MSVIEALPAHRRQSASGQNRSSKTAGRCSHGCALLWRERTSGVEASYDRNPPYPDEVCSPAAGFRVAPEAEVKMLPGSGREQSSSVSAAFDPRRTFHVRPVLGPGLITNS
jgi:hypothetical protein